MWVVTFCVRQAQMQTELCSPLSKLWTTNSRDQHSRRTWRSRHSPFPSLRKRRRRRDMMCLALTDGVSAFQAATCPATWWQINSRAEILSNSVHLCSSESIPMIPYQYYMNTCNLHSMVWINNMNPSKPVENPSAPKCSASACFFGKWGLAGSWPASPRSAISRSSNSGGTNLTFQQGNRRTTKLDTYSDSKYDTVVWIKSQIL